MNTVGNMREQAAASRCLIPAFVVLAFCLVLLIGVLGGGAGVTDTVVIPQAEVFDGGLQAAKCFESNITASEVRAVYPDMPATSQTVTVVVPGLSIIDVDNRGYVTTATTNTKCPPSTANKTYMRVDDKLFEVPGSLFAGWEWDGDFSESGSGVQQPAALSPVIAYSPHP